MSADAEAQQADITFFVVGKHASFRQVGDGEPVAVDYSFFAEIFLTADGDASDATLEFPTGESVDFADKREAVDDSRDNILFVSGSERFSRYADLQDRYPDGRYLVNFESPSGPIHNASLLFERRSLPDAPRIYLRQRGLPVDSRIVAGEDLQVRWSDFHQGGADDNGILDDLVFVILTDESGNRVAHSGRPFEGRTYLNFQSKDFKIDGSVLHNGQGYTLSVEHAILDDTQRFGGVPAMTTRAVTTRLELNVASK